MATPAAAADDTSYPSCLSASAQTRILIWRTEVASALDSPASPPSPASTVPAPSEPSSSSTITTTASSSLLPRASRGRRFWRRIVRRLSVRPDADPAGAVAAHDAAAGAARAHDEVVRTAMYRAAPPLEDSFADEVAPGEPTSDGAAKGALKEKQERLHRAARLLMQQNAMGVPATMAP